MFHIFLVCEERRYIMKRYCFFHSEKPFTLFNKKKKSSEVKTRCLVPFYEDNCVYFLLKTVLQEQEKTVRSKWPSFGDTHWTLFLHLQLQNVINKLCTSSLWFYVTVNSEWFWRTISNGSGLLIGTVFLPVYLVTSAYSTTSLPQSVTTPGERSHTESVQWVLSPSDEDAWTNVFLLNPNPSPSWIFLVQLQSIYFGTPNKLGWGDSG